MISLSLTIVDDFLVKGEYDEVVLLGGPEVLWVMSRHDEEVLVLRPFVGVHVVLRQPNVRTECTTKTFVRTITSKINGTPPKVFTCPFRSYTQF